MDRSKLQRATMVKEGMRALIIVGLCGVVAFNCLIFILGVVAGSILVAVAYGLGLPIDLRDEYTSRGVAFFGFGVGGLLAVRIMKNHFWALTDDVIRRMRITNQGEGVGSEQQESADGNP